MNIKRIIIAALIFLLLPIMVSGQSYVPVGPTTDLNGDVNVPTGSGYYINGIEFTTALGINSMESPCLITGGEISKGTVGTFTVAAITEAYLRNDATAVAPLESVTLAIQSNQVITDANKLYYVIFTYGSPCTISINETIPNGWNAIPIGKVLKDTAGVCHYISAGFRFSNGLEKGHLRAKSLRGIELASGGTLTYSTVDKDFESTALVAYGGYNKFTAVNYDSGATDFRYLYDDGSHAAWTEVGAQSVIDYAHYDDGDGGLGELGVSKYGCHWVYRHVGDGDVYIVYGDCDGSLAEAELAQPPNVPDHLTLAGVLLGCLIVKQDGLVYVAQMVTDTYFTGTAVGLHNSLGAIDGGEADAYYHMTLAEHTIATQAATTSLSGYLATADWDTFNEKADAGANSDITSMTGLTTPLGAAYGGTGVANAAGETITLVGDDALQITTGGATTVTFPTTGTLIANVKEDVTPELGGDQDCNNLDLIEVKTVQFNGVYAIGNSGSTEAVDWQNGAYQSITIDEACAISFSNEYVGTLNLIVTYGGSFALTFDGGVTLLEEGGVEIVTTDAAGTDILIFKNIGTADSYVMGALLDVKD